jgi:hypothetical protein
MVQVGALLWYGGSEIEFGAWPKGALAAKLEPLNEPARKILKYWASQPQPELLPLLPFDASGRLYLPATIHKQQRGRTLWGVAQEITAVTPIYRVRAHEVEVGPPRRTMWQGDQVAYLGWPTSDLEPASVSAERVCAYFAKHGAQRELPLSPVNAFDGSLYLPPLPEPTAPRAPPRTSDTPFPRRSLGSVPPGVSPVEWALRAL